MTPINRSLDSNVSAFGLEGVYLLLMAFWIVISLFIILGCLQMNISITGMLLIVCTSTAVVALLLLQKSRHIVPAAKRGCKRKMHYYLCKR